MLDRKKNVRYSIILKYLWQGLHAYCKGLHIVYHIHFFNVLLSRNDIGLTCQ